VSQGTAKESNSDHSKAQRCLIDIVSSTSPARKGGAVMKTLASALIALSLLIGVAAPASALDARKFFDQIDRESF
jgi:hypothetical protein